MPNENEWLWEADDEPLEGGLQLDEAGPSDQKTAFDSEDAVKAVRLHLRGRSDDALKLLAQAASKGEHLDEIYAVEGHIRFEQGKFKEAGEAFQKLLDEQPRHRTGHYNLGASLYRQGDRAGAAAAFERALNVDPERAQARFGMALCHLHAGRFADALESFNRYLASGEDNPLALLGKAVCLQRTGKSTEAVEAYRRVLARKPDCVDAASNLVAIGLENGDMKLIAEFVGKAKPQSRTALEGAAALALAKSDWAEAAKHLAALTRAAADSWEAWFNLGTAQVQLGKSEEAVKAFGEAAKLNPKSAEVQTNHGFALQQKGDLAGARAAYEKALAIAPGLESALWNLSIIAEQRGDREEAGILLSEAVGKRKNWPEAWFRLGYLQLQAGEPKGAADAFSECLKLQPGWNEAQLNLACALLRAGRKEESAAVLDAAAANGNNAAVLRTLAALSVETRQVQKAVDYHARLEALGDRNAELTYNVGWLLHDVCRYEDAVAAYRSALELKPGFAEAELNLGHALKSLGRDDEARACFDRAVAAKPQLAAQ